MTRFSFFCVTLSLFLAATRAQESTQSVYSRSSSQEARDGTVSVSTITIYKTSSSVSNPTSFADQCQEELKSFCPFDPYLSVESYFRATMCLKAFEDYTSLGCYGSIEEGNELAFKCFDDILTLCPGVPPADGQIYECLDSKLTLLSPKCTQHIMESSFRMKVRRFFSILMGFLNGGEEQEETSTIADGPSVDESNTQPATTDHASDSVTQVGTILVSKEQPIAEDAKKTNTGLITVSAEEANIQMREDQTAQKDPQSIVKHLKTSPIAIMLVCIMGTVILSGFVVLRQRSVRLQREHEFRTKYQPMLI